MEFALSKCAILHIHRGKMFQAKNIRPTMRGNIQIHNLNLEQTYQYLGMQQSLSVDDKEMKKAITKAEECTKKILKTAINAKHKISSINA